MVVVNVMGVILGLAFTWLSSRSDGVADQRLASSFKILWVHGENVRFVLGQVAWDRVDGAEVDDSGRNGPADGHDGDPSDKVPLATLDVVIHDGAAAVIFRMVPSDRHGRLVAVQNADWTSWFARLGEWASGQVRSVHFKRCAETKGVSGPDVDIITLAGSQSRDCVRECRD